MTDPKTDSELRKAALDQIRAALEGGTDREIWAALTALRMSSDVKFDRSGLREFIMRYLDSGPAQRRLDAFYALCASGKNDALV